MGVDRVGVGAPLAGARRSRVLGHWGASWGIGERLASAGFADPTAWGTLRGVPQPVGGSPVEPIDILRSVVREAARPIERLEHDVRAAQERLDRGRRELAEAEAALAESEPQEPVVEGNEAPRKRRA